MKLATDIKPRRTGVVLVEVGKTSYEFKGNPLECEVDNESHSAFLLNTGSFFPVDSEDFARAELKLSPVLDEGSDTSNDPDNDFDPDDEVIGTGAPLEALTPATSKRVTKVK